MSPLPTPRPSGRERQILDLLLHFGPSTVSEVHARMPDPPSYSAVRATLRIMEEKGFVKHREEGTRYVYALLERTKRSLPGSWKQMVDTLFAGKPADALAALIDDQAQRLSAQELDRLADLIDRARQAGR
jgi:BlaI family penicillinase repressor